MSLDLQDLLIVLNPGTILAVIPVGLVVGFLFYRNDRRGMGGIAALVGFFGTIFTVTMMAVRIFQGSTVWEGWLATAALWWVFTLALYVGGKIGRGKEHGYGH